PSCSRLEPVIGGQPRAERFRLHRALSGCSLTVIPKVAPVLFLLSLRCECPMAISFRCPECQQAVQLSEHLAGLHGTCPSCDARILVPDASTPGVAPGWAQIGDEDALQPGTSTPG